MIVDRKKIGRASKKKGYYNETETGKDYVRYLGGSARPTPRSGAFLGWPGDLFFKGNILEDLGVVVDCKFGAYSCPKTIRDWMKKLEDEAENNFSWLDLKIPSRKAYCVIERKYLLRLLEELQGYRKEDKK